MPRKKKIVRAAVRRAWLKSMDMTVPPHIKASKGKQSPLSKSLHSKGYGNWIVGENMGLHPNHGTGGNNFRQKKSLTWALKIEKKYPALLWERTGASVIAKNENVHASTVRQAKRKLKQNEQAK